MALTPETQPAAIRPGVVIDGLAYYPTGRMYLFAFAVAGFQWAIDAINADPNFREQLLRISAPALSLMLCGIYRPRARLGGIIRRQRERGNHWKPDGGARR